MTNEQKQIIESRQRREQPSPTRHPLYLRTFCVLQLVTVGTAGVALVSGTGLQWMFGITAIALSIMVSLISPIIFVLGRRRGTRLAVLSSVFGLTAWIFAVCGAYAAPVYGLIYALMTCAGFVSFVAAIEVVTNLPLIGRSPGVKQLGCGEHHTPP